MNHQPSKNQIVKLSVNTTLFSYLQGSKTRQVNQKSFTRLNAFNYLIRNQKLFLNLQENTFSSFPATIQSLSDNWKWNRVTVRSFLHTLENMDIIDLAINNKGISILMKGIYLNS